jgi:hypothetical protein
MGQYEDEVPESFGGSSDWGFSRVLRCYLLLLINTVATAVAFISTAADYCINTCLLIL